MESAIQKAIAEISKIISDNEVSQDQKDALVFFRVSLQSLLPYEAARDRKIAEDACDASGKRNRYNQFVDTDNVCHWGDTPIPPDKQTYLNQNHPLHKTN